MVLLRMCWLILPWLFGPWLRIILSLQENRWLAQLRYLYKILVNHKVEFPRNLCLNLRSHLSKHQNILNWEYSRLKLILIRILSVRWILTVSSSTVKKHSRLKYIQVDTSHQFGMQNFYSKLWRLQFHFILKFMKKTSAAMIFLDPQFSLTFKSQA